MFTCVVHEMEYLYSVCMYPLCPRRQIQPLSRTKTIIPEYISRCSTLVATRIESDTMSLCIVDNSCESLVYDAMVWFCAMHNLVVCFSGNVRERATGARLLWT